MGSLVTATASLSIGRLRASPLPSTSFVDVHTHLGQKWGQRDPLPVSDLLRWMDRNGIAQAVVLPLISPESWDYPISTDYVLRETRSHRDRLIPFCHIDPRTINLGSYQSKLELLRKYQEAGAMGFGEHKVGVDIDDPRNIELFKACAEIGFPVLFHMDSHRNKDLPGLPGLERVLRELPETTFIGHAQGWWGSISADLRVDEMSGYPSGKVVTGGAIDRLMDQYPNIYGDLSAGSGANAISRDLDFGKDFLIRRADRILFGTDYLMPGQEIPQLSLFDSLDLPEDVREKIFRRNTLNLLGL